MFKGSFKNIFPRCFRFSAGPRPYSRYAQYRRFNNKEGTSFTQLLVDPTSRKYLAAVFGGGFLFYVTHLEQAPVSGRTRFIWLPHWLELKIGNYSYNSILAQTRSAMLPPNHPLTVKVDNIFHKIVEAAAKDPSIDHQLLSDVTWQVHIVNDPTAPPNAFVLPGGKVFVFSSILNICKNDDGLATVLSHEFSHQLARHTAENLSKAPIYSMLGAILYTVTGADIFNRLILDGFLRMPASRQMETEADYIGLMIMSRACFHPEEAVKLWKRMSEFEQQVKGRANLNLEFLSTHPASDRRIENMKSWLPKAQEIYSQSNCGMLGGYLDGFQTVFGGPREEQPGIMWG